MSGHGHHVVLDRDAHHIRWCKRDAYLSRPVSLEKRREPMRRMTERLVRGVCGTLVLAALGFGASQAVAASGGEWAPPGQTCAQFCTQKYGEGTQAIYHYKSGNQWYCTCIL
jgi:hypothetical protein